MKLKDQVDLTVRINYKEHHLHIQFSLLHVFTTSL